MATLPLDGVRILDFTRAYAGPSATLYLAELGAEVIKVEAASRPDLPTRVLDFADNDPGDAPWERAAFFHRLNVDKLDITLDLTRPEGLGLVKRLVAVSDVVVENYLPKTMKGFGLHYEALAELNPQVIMASMSGFGATGPRSGWASYFPGMEAMSALTSVTGYPDGNLLNSGTGYGDWSLGAAGAAAILMALHQRNRTGKGQCVDVAGRDSLLCHLGEAILDQAMNDRTWGPQGNRDAAMAPHDTYRSAGSDRWVAIVVRDDTDWRAFCATLGNPTRTTEERFADARKRWQNQEEMRPLIESWTGERKAEDAAQELLAAGVPAAPVLDYGNVLLDPQMRERGYYEVIEHPMVGRRLFPRQLAALYSAFPPRPRGPSPMLGQHNREVLQSLLGLSDAELEKLEEDGIIGTAPARKSRRRPIPHPFEALKAAGARIDDDYREKLSEAYGERIGPVKPTDD